MKTFLFLLLFAPATFGVTLPYTYLAVSTNGPIVDPTNFVSANGLLTTNDTPSFQPASSVLTNLSTLDGSSLTNLDGANIQVDTINSNKLDAATRALLGGSSSGGGVTLVDGTVITNANFVSNWKNRFVVTDGTNVVCLPSLAVEATGSNFTPDLSLSDRFIFTLTNNGTINAPSNVTTSHVRSTFSILVLQNTTGGYQPTFASNYFTTQTFPAFTIVYTNASYGQEYFFRVKRDSPAAYDITGINEGIVP